MRDKKTIIESKKTIYAYINFFNLKFMKKWILENTPIEEVTVNPFYDLHKYYDEITVNNVTNTQVKKQYSHLIILTKNKREIEV